MSHRHDVSNLQQLEKAMSAFFDKATSLISTIAQGGGDDQATKDAVAEMQTHITTDEATVSELQGVVTSLLEKLAVSTPPAATDTAGADAAKTDAGTGTEGAAGTAA